MMKVGLLINPIAGMGGSVGLKGTDSAAVLNEAINRGAVPIAPDRTVSALRSAGDLEAYYFYTAGGPMGEDVLKGLVDNMTIVYAPEGDTTDDDTRKAARALVQAGIEVLIFAGGDGTARDILDAIGESIPVIGIPSGVKMHSAVFANSPRDAGMLLRRLRVDELPSHLAEVMDIDEEEVGKGRISATLYGYMLTPEDTRHIQPFKLFVSGGSEKEYKEAIAQYMKESMCPDVLYLLGPGTTIDALGKKLGIDKTLLGVDIVANGKLVAKDADERTILKALNEWTEARIVISPIGAQGFIFGRGNQQISPRVIRRVGIRNIIVMATPLKMDGIKEMKIDTGDAELDEELRGYGKVIIGYGKQLIAPIG